jgi:hypothetical protein
MNAVEELLTWQAVEWPQVGRSDFGSSKKHWEGPQQWRKSRRVLMNRELGIVF